MTIVVLLLKNSPNNQYKRTNGWSAVSEFYLGHVQQSIEGGGLNVMEYPPVNGCGGGRVWGLGPLVQEPNGEFLSSAYSFTAIHFIVVIQIKSIISINNSDGIIEKSR